VEIKAETWIHVSMRRWGICTLSVLTDPNLYNSQDSSVNKVTGYGMNDRASIILMGRDFNFRHHF
jgi:hypothetical protein